MRRSALLLLMLWIIEGRAVAVQGCSTCSYDPNLEPRTHADELCYPVSPQIPAGDRIAHCEKEPSKRLTTGGIHFSDVQTFLAYNPDVLGGHGGYHLGEDWNGYRDGVAWHPWDDYGQPVYSIANGVVIWTDDTSQADSWGKTVVIKHVLVPAGYIYSVYAHLSEIRTTLGAQVARGERVGSIGDANGYLVAPRCGKYSQTTRDVERCPHLHFELREWVPPAANTDIFAGRNGYISKALTAEDREVLQQYVYPKPFPSGGPSYLIQKYGAPRLPGTGHGCEQGCGGGNSSPIAVSVHVEEFTETSATFVGVVNPNGLESDAYFIWDDDTTFDYKTIPEHIGNGTDGVAIAASVPVICGGRSYYVKAVGVNSAGEGVTNLFDSFTSPPCTGTNPPPSFRLNSIALESDPNVAGRVAKIVFERFSTGNGTQLYYDLYRNDTLVYTLQADQYNGTSATYDRKGGLYSGQTYTYRIVARDGIGTTPSTNTVTVSIPAGEGPVVGAPWVTSALPDGITANGGYLAADITANGQPTDVVFEWGVDTTYGTATDAVAVIEPTHVSQRVRKGVFGLACDPGVYHYRAVARRDGVPVAYGADQTLVLDCAANTPVIDGKQIPEVATVSLWRMDGAVRTERKTRSEEGTESRRLIVSGYPQSVAGFNGEAGGAYRLVRGNGEFLSMDIGSPEDKGFTWTGWVKLNNPASDHQLLYLYQPAPAGQKQALLLITQEHAVLSLQNPPAQGAVVWSTSIFPAGVWKHLTFTREAGTYRIYLDGMLDATYSAGSNLDVTTLSTTSTTICDCDLDEVHLVYGRAWSGQEIADYYASARLLVVQPPIPTADPPGVAGSLDVRRQDAQFAYIPDYAQHGLDLTFDFTFEAWVKLRTPIPSLSSYTLISKWDAMPAGRSYNFEYYHNGTSPVLRLTTDSGRGHDTGVEIPYTLPLGVWRHVAVSYSASTGRAEFFADCTSLGTASGLTTSVQNGDGSLFIGSRFGYPSLTFDGLIDDVRLWSVKRTAADIAGGCVTTVSSSTPGLVSNWRFDHTLADTTTFGNTLAAFNGVAFSNEDRSDAPPPPPPVPKKSLDLKRSAPGYAYINDQVQHGLDITGDFTVEAWVKPRAMVGTHTILSKWGAGQASYWISYGPDGATRKISVNVSQNGTTEVNKMVAYDLGTSSWKHLAVSCRIVTAGECDVYVNTVKVATLTGFPRSIFSGSGRFELGTAEERTDRLIDGFLDEVRVWNKARTQTEIANDSSHSLTGTEPGLVVYYTFDGTDGSMMDKSPSGNHLTVANTVSFAADTPF